MGSFTLPSAMRNFRQARSFAAPAPQQAPITQMGPQITQAPQGGGWGNVDQARPNPQQVRRANRRGRGRGRTGQRPERRPQPQPSEQMGPGGGFLGGMMTGGNMLGQVAKQGLGFKTPGQWGSAAQVDPNGPPPAGFPSQAANVAGQFQTGLQPQGPAPGMIGGMMAGGNMLSSAPGSSAPPPQMPQAPGAPGGGGFMDAANKFKRNAAGQTGQGAGWGFLTNG